MLSLCEWFHQQTKKWSHWGSNPGPSPYRSDALPTELRDLVTAPRKTRRACVAPAPHAPRQPTVVNIVSTASWCSGSTSDSKSDNGGSIPSEVTFSVSVTSSPMAQSVARQAVNLQVAGSNPAGGDFSPPQQSHVGKSGHRESNPGPLAPRARIMPLDH